MARKVEPEGSLISIQRVDVFYDKSGGQTDIQQFWCQFEDDGSQPLKSLFADVGLDRNVCGETPYCLCVLQNGGAQTQPQIIYLLLPVRPHISPVSFRCG